MKKTIILGMFALTVLMFGACTKAKDGAPGAQGPIGPVGPQGNANVISGTVTISNWTYDGVNQKYTATIIDNEITQEIVDNGLVMVYLYGNGANIALPVTLYPASTYSETLYFTYGLQQIIISVQDSDLTQPNNPGTLIFRAVKVAPALILANPNTNWKNYTDVMKTLNFNN